MEKFISYEKCSKKERRLRDRQKRGSWNGVDPVTRRSENPKAYSRAKQNALQKARIWGDDTSYPSLSLSFND